MSIFDLKGNSGSGNNWNYSDKNKQGYMTMLEGTVVEISNPPSLNYKTKQPEVWPDGNPKRNLCLTIRGRSGRELNWIFAPRSKAADACLAALDPQGTRALVSIEEMLGKFIRVQTEEGVFNQANPRPWWVTILGDGEGPVRGLVDLSQQQPPRQAAPAPAPAPAPVPHQPAPAPAPQPAPAPAYQQPASPVPYDDGVNYYDSDIPF